MRLIDADALKKCAIPCEIHNGALTDLCVPLYQIDNAPTIKDRSLEIAQKSIELGRKVGQLECNLERPQGEWVEEKLSCGNILHCSECGARPRRSEYGYDLRDNFCHNCGADMRGDSDGQTNRCG